MTHRHTVHRVSDRSFLRWLSRLLLLLEQGRPWMNHRPIDERDHHMASVIVTTGDQMGEFLPLGRRTSVIGRAENLPLQIRDALISRKHLRIRFDEQTGGYFAEDMGSHNGVYINNRKIAEKKLLAEDDMILIGTTLLMFTQKDFDDKDSALTHYKKVGEQMRVTQHAGGSSQTARTDKAQG
jgi:pSer/pThr/pTyr-binding forkhead associated (FHA) protein